MSSCFLLSWCLVGCQLLTFSGSPARDRASPCFFRDLLAFEFGVRGVRIQVSAIHPAWSQSSLLVCRPFSHQISGNSFSAVVSLSTFPLRSAPRPSFPARPSRARGDLRGDDVPLWPLPLCSAEQVTSIAASRVSSFSCRFEPAVEVFLFLFSFFLNFRDWLFSFICVYF